MTNVLTSNTNEVIGALREAKHSDVRRLGGSRKILLSQQPDRSLKSKMESVTEILAEYSSSPDVNTSAINLVNMLEKSVTSTLHSLHTNAMTSQHRRALKEAQEAAEKNVQLISKMLL